MALAITIIEFASNDDLENALCLDTVPLMTYLGMHVRPPLNLEGLKLIREWNMLDRCQEYVDWYTEQFQINNISATIIIEHL